MEPGSIVPLRKRALKAWASQNRNMLTRLVVFHRVIVKGLVEHNKVLKTRELLLHAMSYTWFVTNTFLYLPHDTNFEPELSLGSEFDSTNEPMLVGQ